MTDNRTCPRCGSPLVSAGNGALCAACLINAALEDSTAEITVKTVPGGTGPADLSAHPGQIGPYVIIDILGQGGMGVVYLAEQIAPIRRRVALKLIRAGRESHRVIARFDAERQTLALMDHPNIASVFDAGSTDDGLPYFVMEYVPGLPITEFCDTNRLSTRARLELFQHVCSAVQHAHQKGIIHRDLKPSNVLVMDQDGRPLPKVIDFGVARAIEQRLRERSLLTEHGVLIGTPEYMSPEQAGSASDVVDTRTDIYSLGVLLYELLVGGLPFSSAELRRAGLAEIHRIVRESEPRKPSTKLGELGDVANGVAEKRHTNVSTLTRELRGDLDWITLRAIEKEPARRYASASELSSDITRHLEHEPVAAGPPSTIYRLRKFVRKHRGAVAAAAALIAALTIGLAATTVLYRVAASEAATANASLLEAEYRTYVGTLAAAENELRTNAPGEARARLLAVPEKWRGWEWGHLLLRTDTSQFSLKSTGTCINTSTDSSHAGRPLSIVDSGATLLYKHCGTLESWDLRTSAHRAREVPGSILAIGDDGRLAVQSGSPPYVVVQVPDPSGARIVARIGPLHLFRHCASFAPGGTRLAIGVAASKNLLGGSYDDAFEIWDVQSGQQVARMTAEPPPLPDTRGMAMSSCTVEFSPDGTRLASSGAQVHVWDAQTGAELQSVPGQAGSAAQAIAFSADGTKLAIGRQDGLVDVLTVGRGASVLEHFDGNGLLQTPPRLPTTDRERRIQVLAQHNGEAVSLAFSPDGSRLISAVGTKLAIWNVPQARLMTVLTGHELPLEGVVVSTDGSRIFSVDLGGTVRAWPIGASAGVRQIDGVYRHANGIAVSADGNTIATAGGDGSLLAWVSSGLTPLLLKPPGRSTTSHNPMALTPDGRQLWVGESGLIRVWDLASVNSSTMPADLDTAPCYRPNRPIPYSGVAASLLAVSLDGRVVAIGFEESTCVVVRDVGNRAIVAAYYPTDSTEAIRSLAFRPDGSLLIASSSFPDVIPAGHVRLWDWKNNHMLATVPIQQGTDLDRPWRLAASADGSRFAIYGGWPFVVSIWDGNLMRELGRLMTQEADSVALSPDGSRIFTVSMDNAVRVWDGERFQPLLTLSDSEGHAGGVAMTPDWRLIAGRTSGGLTIWEPKKAKRP